MEVLKTTSPVADPGAPIETPLNTSPFSSAKTALSVNDDSPASSRPSLSFDAKGLELMVGYVGQSLSAPAANARALIGLQTDTYPEGFHWAGILCEARIGYHIPSALKTTFRLVRSRAG